MRIQIAQHFASMMQGLFGALSLMLLAWVLGRFQHVNIKKISVLLIFQIFITWLFLKVPSVSSILKGFGHALEGLQRSVLKGTSFVFGYLGGAPAPFEVNPGTGSVFILLFQALPTIVVMGSISMILFHTGILPRIVRHLSCLMERTKIIGAGLATALAGKIFLSQTDAPLLVRPYLEHFSKNELFTLMTVGMATSVSTIFILYSSVLSAVIDQDAVLLHLATSAFTNIIASLIIAEYMQPQKGSLTNGTCENPYIFQSIMQAIARGATDGWSIMMMIAAMMIALIALVDIANSVFSSIAFWITGTEQTIQQVVGYIAKPFVWCMGISWVDCRCVGSILAEKTLLNEWVAITNIVNGAYGILPVRTLSILLYGLCAFSNLSSIGIQIACLGALAPSRMTEIVQLAPIALMASVLSGALSSAIVSMMI